METTCQHYFCVECMKGVIDSGQSGSCPVCKEKIGLLKIPTRMVLRLIAEQEVACKKCGKNIHYEDSAVHDCGDKPAEAHAGQPVVAPEPARALRQILQEVQEDRFSPEVEKICTTYVKTTLKDSADGKTVLFKTGGKVFFFLFPAFVAPSPIAYICMGGLIEVFIILS